MYAGEKERSTAAPSCCPNRLSVAATTADFEDVADMRCSWVEGLMGTVAQPQRAATTNRAEFVRFMPKK
jgi:hypothetical protein